MSFFLIGYIAGVLTGPAAIYGVAFYFSWRDRRAEVSLRDHRSMWDRNRDDVNRRRSQGFGPF